MTEPIVFVIAMTDHRLFVIVAETYKFQWNCSVKIGIILPDGMLFAQTHLSK